MSDNLREFDLGLKVNVNKDVPEQVRKFRNAIALDGLNGLVELTPVKTGRSRGNWQVTTSPEADGYDEERYDQAGAETVAAGESVIAGVTDPFDSIWTHNGIPYIHYVNDGTPKVAAVHMLERTADRLRRIVPEGGR